MQRSKVIAGDSAFEALFQDRDGKSEKFGASLLGPGTVRKALGQEWRVPIITLQIHDGHALASAALEIQKGAIAAARRPHVAFEGSDVPRCCAEPPRAQLLGKLAQVGFQHPGGIGSIPGLEIERPRIQAARAGGVVEHAGAPALPRNFERGGGARDARANDRNSHESRLPEPISACNAHKDNASCRAWAAPTAALRRRAL